MAAIEYLEAAKLIGGLILTFCTIISGLVLWLHRRMTAVATSVSGSIAVAQKANSEEMSELRDMMKGTIGRVEVVERDAATMRNRIATVETAVRGLPSRDDIHGLTLSMTRMEGDIGRIDDRIKPVVAIMERMQELLISRGKDGL